MGKDECVYKLLGTCSSGTYNGSEKNNCEFDGQLMLNLASKIK